MFTGINNPDVNTVCSQGTLLSAAIGFTEGDVRELLDYYGLTSRMDDVKRWYDGYLFAGQEIYCPWDVVNFCSEALELRTPETYEPENYWAGTSDNGVIAEFLEFLSNEDVDQMQTLVDGGVIELKINDKLTYSDFVNHEPTDFWTLLLYSGYLTAVERVKGKLNTFRVKIPNEEIRDTFDQSVRHHFSKTNRHYGQLGFTLAKTVMSGDADAVRKVLLPLLRKYVSVRDEATKAPPENYYQGFLSAMFACAGDSIANFHANSEAGTGFADILFTSPDQDVGVVIEIKRCDKREEMPIQAQRALMQIQNKEYAQGLEDYACKERYAYGIAFCNKSCVVLCSKVGARTTAPLTSSSSFRARRKSSNSLGLVLQPGTLLVVEHRRELLVDRLVVGVDPVDLVGSEFGDHNRLLFVRQERHRLKGQELSELVLFFFLDKDGVLNADAVTAGLVDAGLVGEEHSGEKCRLACIRE